jgi:hypothetical protein
MQQFRRLFLGYLTAPVVTSSRRDVGMASELCGVEMSALASRRSLMNDR